MVQGISPPCDTEVELYLTSHKGQGAKNWSEVNGRHIARRDHHLELLAHGAPINVVSVATTPDYMPWFLSISR